MTFRPHIFPLAVLSLLLSMSFSGCETLGKKKEKDKVTKPSGPTMADQNSDVAFQAFLTRLRKAVDKHDALVLASMMSADFGFSWSPGGEGAGVFQYWQVNNLWPEVGSVLRQRFVPSANYMVAPAQVASDPDYKGYRAGLRLINGSWRFCYFVPAPPPAPAETAPAPASHLPPPQ